MQHNVMTATIGNEKINMNADKTEKKITEMPPRTVKMKKTTIKAGVIRRNANTRGVSTGVAMIPNNIKRTGCF